MNKKTGYSVIEVLIASAISVIVLGSISMSYIFIQRSWKETAAKLFLQQKARIIMNKIIYGGGSTDGIIGAKETEIYKGDDPVTGHKPGDTIYFKLKDGIERCFYIADEMICFDPDRSTEGDEIALNDPDAGVRAVELSFIPEFYDCPMGTVVTLEQTIQNRNIRTRLQSMVNRRN